MAFTENHTVKVEMTAEEILAITTIISVFKDTTTALEMDVPKELKKTIANFIEKIMLELMFNDEK